MTHLAASYNQGPAGDSYGWDQEFWDRHYKAERMLSELVRNGKRCKTPCSQTYYSVKHSFATKDELVACNIYLSMITNVKLHLTLRVPPFEYGKPEEWASAISIMYTSLKQEER